jgi:hypothetical protein
MLDVNLNEAGGRTAYLAGFHAAQATLRRQDGRTDRGHGGKHSNLMTTTECSVLNS